MAARQTGARRNAGKRKPVKSDVHLSTLRTAFALTTLFKPSVKFLPLLALALLGMACSPALNWRDVRPEGTRLALLLPCKPDKVQKSVALGGTPVLLTLTGCDAAGATFALAVADLGDAARAGPVLAQWQRLTLANMKADQPVQPSQLKVPGSSAAVPPVLVTARGKRADGSAVSGQAAYFAQGSQVFQAVLYADKLAPGASETFFASLRFE